MKLTSAPRYRILSKLSGVFLTLELDSIERSAHISDLIFFTSPFILPPVLLQTTGTRRSLLICLVGNASSDSSPIKLNHN